MLPGRKPEVNKKSQSQALELLLLLKLRRDPWDRHRVIMRASLNVSGQENREVFVRAVCKKRKKKELLSLADTPTPSTTTLCTYLPLPSYLHFFFLTPSPRSHTHTCLYLPAVPGDKASTPAGERLRSRAQGLFCPKEPKTVQLPQWKFAQRCLRGCLLSGQDENVSPNHEIKLLWNENENTSAGLYGTIWCPLRIITSVA